MRNEVTFTMSEMKRYGVIQALLEKKMTITEAALALDLSTRQIKRVKKKVIQDGPQALHHGNRGRPPSHAFSPEFRQQVIEVAQRRYSDFNFSHLSQILAEDEGIHVNRETLRLWLRPLGFGRKVHRLRTHRQRRKRSAREGQMLFLDGSPHRWFGAEESCLILCTDDATGKPLYGVFQEQEDLTGCLRVCGEVFQNYGLPTSFYLDRASHFTTTRHGGVHVSQRDDQPTQFERAMQELAVHLIFAHSPQARGRGERINGTFQDRLVAELRLKEITCLSEATHYLNHHFIPSYARRFGVQPEEKQPAWRDIPQGLELKNILCRRFQRTVTNDNTISVQGHRIQLLPTPLRLHFVKAKVEVNHWVDDSWHVFHPQAGEIPCKPIEPIPTECPAEATLRMRPASGARPAGAMKKLTAGERSESAPHLLSQTPLPAAFGKKDIFSLQKR